MKNFKIQNNGTVRFRRFSNCPFAVFRSLNQRISIGVLTISMLTFANVEHTLAQESEPQREKLLELEEIEVTGSRVPVSLSQAARMVTVLTREQIASAPVKSVNDLLKYAVGVDVRQRGQMGMQTDISIRGGQFNQITILLNGININDPQTGHNAVDFPVDIHEIERIEILEGPAGRIYGTSSLVGAINVVTKQHAQNGASVHAETGSYGYMGAGAALHLSKSNFKNQFSGNFTRTDGFTRSKAGNLSNNFNAGKFFYQGIYQQSDFRLNWHAGYSQKDFGSNTFYSAKFDNQFEHTAKIFSALQAETHLNNFTLKGSAYWNRYHDRFELIKNDPSKVPFNYHRTDVMGISFNGYVESILGKTALGVEMRNEDIISTKLGEPLHETQPIHGTDKHYIVGLNRTSTSMHLEHNVKISDFALSAGVIAAKHTWNEMPIRFYPGIDLSYQPTRDWKVYASYNTSLRLPTFTELYYNIGDRKADKYLKPEEMQAFEVGIKYLTPALRATANVYHNRGKNMIDWIKDNSIADALWESVNHTRINTTGFGTSFLVDFKELLPTQDLLRSVNISYNYISQKKDEKPHIQSRYSLEYLRHKLVAQSYFHLFAKLNWNISFRWQDRVGTYTDPNKQVHEYTPYSLVDTRLSWDAQNYSIYAEANNLLNKTYYDYGDVPQPGFWFQVGVKYAFDF